MRRPSRKMLSWMFVLCANHSAIAQNLEAIGRGPAASLSGGFSVNQVFSASKGMASRRGPYSLIATGNVNLSIYGWSLPFSFTASNQRTSSFAQPFNQYSIHPTWKWITAHAGYTSMSFSPYTINGHVFSGAAIEAHPNGRWKVSALYGRFLKAAQGDSARAREPSYQRMGYGAKLSYGSEESVIDLIAFHALDLQASLSMNPDTLAVLPQENMVISLGGGTTIFKSLVMKAELATSAFTRDTRAEKASGDHWLSKMPLPFQTRLSTAYYLAMKASIDYQRDGWVVGLGYERVDPEYRTLGAYYFNNDLENVTINTSAAFWKKLNVALSAGIQHDNLHDTKVSTMRRLVNAVNINYTPGVKLNASASWSTFQTHTKIRPQFESISQLTPFEDTDTLNFIQISRNATVSAIYVLDNSEKQKQNVSMHFTWQRADETQADVGQPATSFYNLNTGYTWSQPARNTTAGITFIASINNNPFTNTRTMGPTASMTKAFFSRKLRATMSSSWNSVSINGLRTNRMFNARFTGMLAVRNKHHLSVSGVLVKRSGERTPAITEFTAMVGYNYSFSREAKQRDRNSTLKKDSK